MSGMHGVLSPQQPGYYYITLEESYVVLFRLSATRWYDAHKDEEQAEKQRDARLAHAVAKAYITDVLVNLSNKLQGKDVPENDLWVFLSFPELEERLHGACKLRTLKEAMKELVEDGYVFKRPNRDPRFKSLEYRLNLPQYRQELQELPPKSAKNDGAISHDESADLHRDSAKMHDDDAKMHCDSANSHPRMKEDRTQNQHRHKQRENDSALPSAEKEASPAITLSDDEQQFHNLYHGSDIAIGDPHDITTRQQAYYAELAPDVRTLEDLMSLYTFTKAYLERKKSKDQTAYLGNLANCRKAWRQSRIQPLKAPTNTEEKPNSISGTDEKAADAVIERLRQRALQKQQKKGA